MLRGAGDQPGRGRGQRDAGGDRERPEQHAGAPSEPAPGPCGRHAQAVRRRPRHAGRRGAACAGCGSATEVDRVRRGGGGQREHPVGGRGHGGSVRHDDHGGALGQPAQRAQEHRLGVRVEVGGRLVEEDKGTAGHDDAGQRQPRPLTGRQPGTVLAQRRVDAERQGGDRVAEADSLERPPELLVVGAGPADPDVVGHGAVGQPGTLRCPRHLAPPGVGVGGTSTPPTRIAARGGRDARRSGWPAGSTSRSRTGRPPRSGRVEAKVVDTRRARCGRRTPRSAGPARCCRWPGRGRTRRR